MAKALFLNCPMLSDELDHAPVADLRDWERDYLNTWTNAFKLLASDYENQQNDPLLFPGRMSLEEAKKLPPVVLQSAEFCFVRRDFEAFKELT